MRKKIKQVFLKFTYFNAVSTIAQKLLDRSLWNFAQIFITYVVIVLIFNM